MIGGFQVGPFQINYQQGGVAPPASPTGGRFKKRGYRPSFIPNEREQPAPQVPQLAPVAPAPRELEVVALVRLDADATAETSIHRAFVAEALAPGFSPQAEPSRGRFVAHDYAVGADVSATVTARRVHSATIQFSVDLSAEVIFDPLAKRPISDREALDILNKLLNR